MLGAVDSSVLERIAKIMSYMSLAGTLGMLGWGGLLSWDVLFMLWLRVTRIRWRRIFI